VLEDCEIPTSQYPLQFNGLSLAQIARKLCAPFKVDVVIDDSVSSKMNSSFKVSTASESQNISSYLAELASQKDIVMSHNEKGQLLFTKAKTDGEPILEFDTTKGTLPGTSFAFTFDGQGMHSHVTVQKQASSDGGNAGEETKRNPYVVGSYAFRPTVKSQSSGDDNQTGSATQRAVANELKGIKLTIEIDRWKINGKIIRPNNTLTIVAPEVYIPRKETFFIESVNFTGDEKEQKCTLNCVLPGVYDGKAPVNIFRGINLHPLTEPSDA
jgi:prophage tail gpP-like protein